MRIADMHCDTISELLEIRRKGDPEEIRENTLRQQQITY